MAGYTRQSTASIINGSSITAPPINAEFNQLLAAFNATTGHGHTGATGDAPKIPLTTSVSGYLPLVHGGVGGRNNVTNSVPTANDDSGDGYAPGSVWENSTTGRVYICVGNSSGAAVWRELVQVDSGNAIIPASNNTVDLGNNSTRFQDLFLSGGIAAAGNVAIGGTLTTTGTSAFTGLATFANLSATGTTTITSVDLNSGAIDNAVIGNATPAAGTFTTLNANTSLVAATADINGGTIDGAALGASSPSTGSFTTLGASGTSTLATVDINGGNIDGTVIGASTTAAGSFTTLSTSGQATLATADINGGSIDGSTIGANSASTGAFTTLSSSGGITGSLTGNVTGNTAGVHTGAVTGNVTGNLTGNVTAGSGTSTFTNLVVNGNLNMNAGTSATITNLTAPSSDLDAATKKYVDDEISTLIGDAGAGLDTLGELADALNDDDDFSTTVTNSIATKLPKAGGTMTGAIAMSTNKITGAGDPTSAQDVSTKVYTDTQRDTRVAKTGDTMSGALAMGNNKITGLATPTAGTDVTNKTYVDGILGSATVAATSATNAATSETNAATSATSSANSAAAALVSKNAAATSLSTFQNQYLGAQSSAPTQDPDGSALDVGDLYFDTVANAMKVYSSSGWTNAGSSVNGTSNRVTYTATAGQTVFAATYDSGYLDTFLNGVKLLSGTDFTATNGTSITLASGASVNDVVDIVAYGTFELADHYTRTASDARYVEVAGDIMTGALTTTGLTVDGGSNGTIDFGDVTTAYGRLYADNTGTFVGSKTNQPLILRTNNTERMRIDASGRVGIGTSSPNASFKTTLSGLFGLRIQSADTNNSALNIGCDTNSGVSFIDSTKTGTGTFLPLRFATNDTERMRIDASGNVLVGTTSNAPTTTAGINLGSNNKLHATRSGGTSGYFNRLTNDGGIVEFAKDGTYVGNIGTNGGDLTIGTGNVGLKFNDSANLISAWDMTANAPEDGVFDLGYSNGRFKDLYLSGTTHANQYRLKNGNATTGGLFHEKDLVGSGSSYDTSLFAETGNALHFMVNGSATAVGTFDTSGNLLVGKTSGPNYNVVGVDITSLGEGQFTVNSNPVLQLNRKTSDGDIAVFRKDGSTVGSIGTANSGDLYIGNDDTTLLFAGGSDAILPRGTAGASRDGAIDLGLSAHRFKDAYLSGGVYLGGTGSANKLEDYEEGFAALTISGSSSGSTTYAQNDIASRVRYTKIGRFVHATFLLNNQTFPTFSGEIRVNLPFTAYSGAYEARSGDVYFYNSNTWDNVTNFMGIVFRVGGSQSYGTFGLIQLDNNRQTTLSSSNTSLSSAGGIYMRMNITYETDS